MANDAYADVSDLQDQLDITDAADDVLLDLCLAASSRAVDQWCGRRFFKDTTASARYFAPDEYGRVQVDDFWSTTGLVIATDTDDSGSYATTWATTDYELEPRNGIFAGRENWPYTSITPAASRSFPEPRLHSLRVSVTAKWGWSAVPDEVKLATVLKAVRLYRRKFSPEGTAGGFDLPVVRVTGREDPDVAALLQPFRKLAVV